MKSAETSPSNAATINPADLTIGGVYTNSTGAFVYLGKVDTVEDIVPSHSSAPPKTSAGAELLRRLRASESRRLVNRTRVEGEHLTLQLQSRDLKAVLGELQQAMRRPIDGQWRFSKEIVATEHLATLPLSYDWMECWKREAMRHLFSTLNCNTRGGPDKPAWGQTRIAEHSAVLHAQPHGTCAAETDAHADEYAAVMTHYRNL